MPDLDRLLARVVDETITPEEFCELEKLLEGDPQAQERYMHYLNLHSDLLVSSLDVLEPAAPTQRRWELRGVAAVAALLILFAGFLFALKLLDGYEQMDSPVRLVNHQPVVRIVELHGAVNWSSAEGQMLHGLRVGQSLDSGTLESLGANSWVEIAFHDGTSVWVSGPGALTFSETARGKLIRLREGELSLDVTPQPKEAPLRLLTASAEIEVLGTQFNITADQSSTRLAVNKGLVRVTRLADGRVQEVPADHHVVAALEQETKFDALPRGESVEIWKAELPKDVRQGQWRAGQDGEPGFVRAESHLYRGDGDPLLLHSVVVSPRNANRSPILLTEKARLRIVGQLDRSHSVSFGFGTHRVRGGLAGKYDAWREIELEEDANGRFEIEVSIEEIPRLKDRFPESPVGHELAWLWIQTVKEDAGLQVISVELVRSDDE